MQNQKADVLVLFGITGDLARKLVLPALYRLVERGELTVPLIGVALTDLDTDGLRHHVADCVRTGVRRRRRRRAHPHGRAHRTLVAGNYADPSVFTRLAAGRRAGRVRGALPRRAAVALRHGGRRDRRGGPGPALAADRREAVRARPRLRGGAERTASRSTTPRTGCSGWTTSSARSRSRTCSCCGSPTRCSSRCGTGSGSTTSRSRWPRTSTSPTAARSTTPSAPCATSCRTTCCRCSPTCSWSRRRRRRPTTSATRSTDCCARCGRSTRPRPCAAATTGTPRRRG